MSSGDIGLVRHLAAVLDRSGRWRLAVLAVVILIGSLIEVLGVGLIVPYVTAVSNPSEVLAHPKLAGPLSTLGMDEPRSLILGLSLAMALAFLLKNVYLALQWRAFYTFLFRQVVAVARRLLSGYLRSPYTFHLGRNSAALVRNTTVEVNHLFMGVVHPLLILATESFVALGLTTLLFVNAPSAAAAAVIVLGLGGGGFFLARPPTPRTLRQRSGRSLRAHDSLGQPEPGRHQGDQGPRTRDVLRRRLRGGRASGSRKLWRPAVSTVSTRA